MGSSLTALTVLIVASSVALTSSTIAVACLVISWRARRRSWDALRRIRAVQRIVGSGAISPNEARALLDLAPFPDKNERT